MWVKDKRVWLAIAIALLVLLGGGYFLLQHRSSPWQPATIAYDPACKTDCKKLSDRLAPHAGPFKMMVQANLDDEIAQWGDCLQSVANCAFAKADATNRDVGACVAQAKCPQSCKERFTRATAGVTDFSKQLDAFEAVFVNAGAPCAASAPRGAR